MGPARRSSQGSKRRSDAGEAKDEGSASKRSCPAEPEAKEAEEAPVAVTKAAAPATAEATRDAKAKVTKAAATGGAKTEVESVGLLSLPGSASGGASGWKGFCTAFGNLIARPLDTPLAPVLCETGVAEKLAKQKQEFKEKKMIAIQKKGQEDKGHTAPDVTKKSFELQLRKVATQGVVSLFNAVKDYQIRQEKDDNKAERVLKTKVPVKFREQILSEKSKAKFEAILKTRKGESQKRAATSMDEFG